MRGKKYRIQERKKAYHVYWLTGRIIKLISEELGLMSLFQDISKAAAVDCVIDSKIERILFAVKREEMGLAVGRSGGTVKNIQKAIGRPVELVEWSDDPKQFVMNSLNPLLITEVRMSEQSDGNKETATVVVDGKKMGAVLGIGGRNAERARLLAKRHFSIERIRIVAQAGAAIV